MKIFLLPGLFVLSTNLLGLVVAFIVGLPINALIQNMLQLLTAGILACLLLSCVSYLCAAQVEDWKLNPKGNTGAFLKLKIFTSLLSN